MVDPIVFSNMVGRSSTRSSVQVINDSSSIGLGCPVISGSRAHDVGYCEQDMVYEPWKNVIAVAFIGKMFGKLAETRESGFNFSLKPIHWIGARDELQNMYNIAWLSLIMYTCFAVCHGYDGRWFHTMSQTAIHWYRKLGILTWSMVHIQGFIRLWCRSCSRVVIQVVETIHPVFPLRQKLLFAGGPALCRRSLKHILWVMSVFSNRIHVNGRLMVNVTIYMAYIRILWVLGTNSEYPSANIHPSQVHRKWP